MNSKNILVTGSAGFIGYHISRKLIAKGFNVIGLDNLNDYYEISLKKERLRQIQNFCERHKNVWHFVEGDIEDMKLLKDTTKEENKNV